VPPPPLIATATVNTLVVVMLDEEGVTVTVGVVAMTATLGEVPVAPL
jgi:hypothetical protein